MHDAVKAVSLAAMANAIRALAIDAVEAARSGHPGMPLGMADVATVLFTEFLKFDAADPAWPDRDRFVLSAGHGSMLLYALLHLTGHARPTLEDLRRFRQLHSPCAGHPEATELPGVETTTGPLGQGLATAVGMAIAERHLNAVFGDELVDHRTFVIAGDGCLMEGVSHEAAALAGHLRLGRLVVLFDDNRVTIDGPVALASSEDTAGRFRAAGWHVVACDGHDHAAVRTALHEAIADPRPSLVMCRTVIGFGAPTKAGTAAVHGSPLGPDEAAATKAALGWSAAPFEVPADLRVRWEEAGRRGRPLRLAWEARLAAHPEAEEFRRRLAGRLPPLELVAQARSMATRKASELVLAQVNARLPETIGGSADLTSSNNTRTAGLPLLTRENYGGRYLHYGVREFAMAAAMNGMALHGGIIPYGGTFLVFSDYARPAIRLAALQRLGVIFVLTHDSIGLGEDGPTHQPVEHLMSLRAIPDLVVYRPADAVETAECWALALADRHRPSVLALTRQDVPVLREPGGPNRSAAGAYRLVTAQAPRQVVIAATGSEVAVAVGAARLLEAQDIGCDVVSVPCWERFLETQSEERKAELFPAGLLRVSLEAGVTLGWERIVGSDAVLIGLDRFGASAPGAELFRHFGFTPEAVAARIRAALRRPGSQAEAEGSRRW
ncbi:MAG: transketolase [Sphingomonadaceae bacterium]|uniref:transketolase n=1 Tax=Thermaurantiacus sp. TaxID=2820283 RepID=UPI00298F0261|nr:transketolase [Thermaurantiacus sp.]MCS6986661.1 transketolase [Sphingomonadaceae bacterium]MDW8414077.1 transketolase [Thermaurantiacus sp.]